MKNVSEQAAYKKIFGSSNGKSIILLNAILKNNSENVCKLLVSTTVEEREKMLNSVFVQEKGRIVDSQIDLSKVAINYNCDPYIIEMLKLAINGIEQKKQHLLLMEELKLEEDDDSYISYIDELDVKLGGTLGNSSGSSEGAEEE